MAAVARIGTEFAGYRVEAVVGRGATSIVYRAEYLRLGTRVALKILTPETAEDEAFRERFVREARLAAAINHPNVITIYDAGVWDETLYIAMRYVQGGDLRAWFADARLDDAGLLSILGQAAGGLDAAHAFGVIHRDVKPANILVAAAAAPDAPETAYVSDFGLTKHAGSDVLGTPTGAVLGTISYVAPEQIEGRPIDARADVYSLGCVAFEGLTSRTPFIRENDAAVLWAHLQEPAPSARALRRDLPPEVDEVVARALAKSPADRFATCGEFVAALREALLPTGPTRRRSPARDPRRAERERRPSRLGRIAAAALVAAVAGAAGVFAGMTVAGGEGSASERTVTEMRTVTQPPLLAYVPEALRPRCRRTRSPRPDFDDSLLCRGGPTVRVVRYSRALNVDALHDYFADRAVAAARVRPAKPGREFRAVGSCNFKRLPAVLEWSAIRREGHETIEASQDVDAEGQVICRESGGATHIEWIAFESKIYAHAYGPDYRSVYRWWLVDSGPIN